MRRAGRLAALSFALCLFLPAARATTEEELKAAIIYKLLMFVDWPADALPPMAGTLVLCLPPESRYAAALRVMAEQPLRGLQLQLRTAPPADVTNACNALLLEASKVPALAHPPRGASVLVIADDGDVAAEGVVISLRRSDNKVLFDLNLTSARRARLQLSSKLMRLARGVVE